MNIKKKLWYLTIIATIFMAFFLQQTDYILANDINDTLLKLLSEEKNQTNPNMSPTNNISNRNNNLDNNLNNNNFNNSESGFRNQEELNKFIDSYIAETLPDNSYYSDNQSIGDLKVIIKNKYIFPNEPIDISVIKVNIDPLLDFEKAEYSFSVSKGDKLLELKENLETSDFQYTFTELGKYQIRVRAKFDNAIVKEGVIQVETIDKISLDYMPLSPAAGDKIEVTVPYIDRKEDIIEWYVNGEKINVTGNKLEFMENKGIGAEYLIRAIIKDSINNRSKYYGETNIVINKPTLRVDVNNISENNKTLDIDNLSFDNEVELKFLSSVNNFSNNSNLIYTYRVNDEVIPSNRDNFTLKVYPNKFYKVYISVSDLDKELILNTTIFINRKLEGINSNEEDSNETNNNNPFLDRYLGLVFIGLISVGGLYMSKHAVIKD